MRLFGKSLELPTAAQALPGRATPVPVTDRHFVNGQPIKGPFAAGLQQAVFGLGCFWGAERRFWQMDGVVSTAVGYAGGHTPNPTYQEVCSGATGHTEVVLVDEVGDEGVMARSYADAPEIDGVVHLTDAEGVAVGDVLLVEVEDADEHDLYAVPQLG